MGRRCRWDVYAVLCGLLTTLSCGTPPRPGDSPPSSGYQVIDDDDYEHLPTLPVATPTPVPDTGPTPGHEDTETPSIEETPLPPPPQPNVSGTLYAGQTSPSTDVAIRIAFYNTMQRSAAGTPLDVDDFIFELTLFPPVSLPATFFVNLPRGDEYLAEAWQDADQNGIVNGGDLVGDSDLFFTSDEMATIEITLAVLSSGE